MPAFRKRLFRGFSVLFYDTTKRGLKFDKAIGRINWPLTLAKGEEKV
jgi:hypothetical protein